MSNTNTGGSAFPSHGSMGEVVQQGMTLRDYFAAKALTSFLLNQKPEHMDEPATYWAQAAYEFADAMMEVREE